VVNYSMQDTSATTSSSGTASAGSRNCRSSTDLGGRFLASLLRKPGFLRDHLAIEVPLGIVVAAVDAA